MAAIVWSDVTDAFPTPALLGISPRAQTIYLSIVNGAGLSAANFGGEGADLLTSARIFYAAHLATMGIRAGFGTSGPVTAQSEGGASQSYAFPWMNPALLMLTSYGQMLAQIIKGTPARAGMVI